MELGHVRKCKYCFAALKGTPPFVLLTARGKLSFCSTDNILTGSVFVADNIW